MGREEVETQLGKILSSPQFSQAGRLSRFLRFVVERAQSGDAGTLKEYLIGVEVFDRGKDFDPRIDPIVRTQAAKVRSKLLEYYAGEGARDPIVISIPKGGYAPEIRALSASATRVQATAPAAAVDPSRIAVLPFVNVGADPENEYFSDGLTEELINRLGHVPGLQVVGRTSVQQFKGQAKDIREIGSKLGVGVVVEGSVRKDTDQVRVTVQLVDVASGYQLLSRTYQREFKGIFELQDELATAVVHEIRRKPVQRGGEIATKSRPARLDGYNKYLRAMFTLSNRYTDVSPAIELFQASLDEDPDYAPTWAGLSQAWWMRAWMHQGPATEAMPRAKSAAEKALELDAGSALGHVCMGIVESGFEWRWASAESHFRKAIQLQPSLPTIYPFYAFVCLMPQLRMEEAFEMAEFATSLDPYNMLFHAMATFIYGTAGRFDDAVAHNTLIREMAPKATPSYGLEGLIAEWRGEVDKAIAPYRKACELAAGIPHPHLKSFLGHALAVQGHRAEAEQILRELAAQEPSSALDIARIYVGLRDEEESLRWLETASKERSIHLLAVPADNRFDWLRRHPRFQNVIRQMHLSPP